MDRSGPIEVNTNAKTDLQMVHIMENGAFYFLGGNRGVNFVTFAGSGQWFELCKMVEL